MRYSNIYFRLELRTLSQLLAEFRLVTIFGIEGTSSFMSEGFTQEALKRLESAIAQGTTKVAYSDRLIVYRSLDEMLQIRDLMKRKLVSSLTLPATQGVVMKFEKGFNKI